MSIRITDSATGGGGGGTPGGSNTQLQFNSAGSFGGIPTATFDGTNLNFTNDGSWSDTSASNSVTFNSTGVSIVAGGGANNLSIAASGLAQWIGTNFIFTDTSGGVLTLNAGTFQFQTPGAANYLIVQDTSVDTLVAYSVGGVVGVTAGPFTTITSITVVGGIITSITGS